MMAHLQTIWGKQIGLRPFEDPLTDLEIARVYRWSNDSKVLRWSGGTPTDLTFEEFRNRLRSEQRNPIDNRIAFFIVIRDHQMIGRIGIFAIDWNKREGELGIVLGETSEWNKGYGRQAISILLRYIFQETSLERINLFTFSDNVRAQHSFIASGFRSLGIARRFSPDIGEFDGIEMEITQREFLAQSKNSVPVSQNHSH